MITAVDLFSGAGGMTGGLVRAGVAVTGALDNWDAAVRTYRLNFSHPIVQVDIAETSPHDFLTAIHALNRRIDIVVGGPPCQGFSIQRIGADNDDRNTLILEFAKYVLAIRPRMYLMENVPGLLGVRGQTVISNLETMLHGGGYTVRMARVNAAEYGVPQKRRRIFYYGWLVTSVKPFTFPKPTCTAETFRTVWNAIGDLPAPPNDYSPSPTDPLHRRIRLSAVNVERLRHIPPGGGFESLPVDMRVNAHKSGPDKIGHRYVYGRLAPDTPAGTITARFDSFTRGKFAHPFDDRNITLREGARLQTFPDDFKFVGTQEEIAALIGNSVPPLLAERIGCAMLEHLRGGRDDEDDSGGDTQTAYQALEQLGLFD